MCQWLRTSAASCSGLALAAVSEVSEGKHLVYGNA